MPNHSFSSAKELLTAAYARNWRTATQTLPLIEQYETERSREWSPQLVWGWWRLEDFPTSPENTWGQRYDYIDQYLKKLLGAQPHPTRPHHNLRPDLNGASGTVRAWLMHKVLQHMIKHKDLGSRSPNDYNFPEDLEKIADDIYVLHKFHRYLPRGPARTLQHYKTAEDLRDAIRPWRQKYPLSSEEQIEAHRKFLKLSDSENNIIYSGNGEAELIATLEDGTEIIQPKTISASRAYGSPRWCTAYRNTDRHFNTYSDDLLIIHHPEGNRWQLHFRTLEFKDDDDIQKDNLASFVRNYAGLEEALATSFKRAFIETNSRSADRDSLEALNFGGIGENERNLFRLLTLAKVMPKWRDAIAGDAIQAYLDTASADERRIDQFLEILSDIQEVPQWVAAVNPECFGSALKVIARIGSYDRASNLLLTIDAVPQWKAYLINSSAVIDALTEAAKAGFVDTTSQILDYAKSVPELRAALAKPDGLPSILCHCRPVDGGCNFKIALQHKGL